MRTKRLYLPGVVFHITARAHCKERYFEKATLRDAIAGIIARALRRTDAHLIAYTILPNHYHLVVHQGVAPLAQLLQPINREIALAVHRNEGRKGHVFERRFFAKPCVDAAQMREMIVYTHRNAVRARLCKRPDHWAWSSHCVYADDAPTSIEQPRIRTVLDLFSDDAKGRYGREGYSRYMKWRQQCDQLPEDAIQPPAPRARFGDIYYSEFFSAAPKVDLSPGIDLRDVVLRTMKMIAPDLTLDYVRLALRTRPFLAIRRAIILDAIRARHRVRDIARFLNVSDSSVSRVAASMYPRPPVRFDS